MKWIVGVDDSPNSSRAFNQALALWREGDEIVVVHILDRQDPMHDKLDRLTNLEQSEKAKDIKLRYTELCKQAGVRFSIIVAEGEVKSELVKQVEALSGDKILVVGARGLGYLQKLLLGSVSEYCMQHVSCPFLVVK